MKKSIITVLLLFAMSIPCVAGPYYEALKSFRVLVSDFSETSGGLSPAISPSGEELAYYSAENSFPHYWDVYLMNGLSFLEQEGTTVDSKKLEYTPTKELVQSWGSDAPETRDIDWSPDGDFLAFVGKGGHLYVTDVWDPVAKKQGETRVVVFAEESVDGGVSSVKLMAPRWSPDGKRIAYITANYPKPAKVCVVDVASGQTTVLAEDALNNPSVWEQPWSPDSKSIVYAGGKGSISIGVSFGAKQPATASYNTADSSFIAVVSVDGKQRSEICRGASICPSWSPRGDRIAYIGSTVYSVKVAEKGYVGGATMAVWTTDAKGRNKKQLTKTGVILKETALQFEALFTKAAAKEFEEEFAVKLTPAQLKKLKSGKMTATEMIDIASKVVSKETGVKFKDLSFYLNDPKSMSAMSPKQAEAASRVMTFCVKALMEIFPQMMKQVGEMDMKPVWSPDGQKVAFVRGFPTEDYENKLMVLAVNAGKSSVLMEQTGIESVSWAKNGKLLVTECRRLMSRQGKGMEIKSQPGYPEIWLLEPK